MAATTMVSYERNRGNDLASEEFIQAQEKYKEEQEKRMRKDGIYQYIAASKVFIHYDDDPYTKPIQRDPIQEQVNVVIIGGGFGGMLTAVRLIESGIERIRIVEKAGDFGGTWYWNRYPGAGP